MAKKAPRRTAERIAEVTLELFNRFGEPNVSTTLISAELNISPGNLYYHFASKDALVNRLFDQYEVAMLGLLDAASDVQDIEDAWFFLHSLFEQIWQLETHFHAVLERKTHAFRLMLESLAASELMRIDPDSIETLSASMSVMVTYWLSYEYVRNPRQALEPASAGLALTRGAQHVLALLTPYMASPDLQSHLQSLTAAYSATEC